MSFMYALQKLKKKKAAPSRVIELDEKSKQDSTGSHFFKTENLYSIS